MKERLRKEHILFVSLQLLETFENRPPLPPKTMNVQEPPIPPPRRNRGFGIRSATSSPTQQRKVFFPVNPMGSLKRFSVSSGMGERPLPG